jgi:hypothetical protein
MSKMGELYLEVEELLSQGYTAKEVSKLTNLPLSFIHPIEDDLMAALDPRNYGPDYDEE